MRNENIYDVPVSGSFELPLAAKYLADSGDFDAVICMGCLIKGDTSHYEYISSTVTDGIMQVGLDSKVPCVFGVLTCLEKQQAVDRATGANNHGLSWATAAVEMALLRRQTNERAAKKLANRPELSPLARFLSADRANADSSSVAGVEDTAADSE